MLLALAHTTGILMCFGVCALAMEQIAVGAAWLVVSGNTVIFVSILICK